MPPISPLHLTRDAEVLAAHVARRLAAQRPPAEFGVSSGENGVQVSAVLFLLSPAGPDGAAAEGVHLILNKRSPDVRQAGDLCCPGGGVTPVLDRFLAGLLRLPGSPLTKWSQWVAWRRRRSAPAQRLALLLGTALREGLEEMRLNPMGVRFLGPLPVERLVVFRKEIYPFVGWVGRQRRFRPNWEVAELVYLPVKALLNPGNYARLHYRFNTADTHLPKGAAGEMLCYLHRSGNRSEAEILWGATFRITMRFLDLVFDFRPPPMDRLPVVMRDLDDNYVNGKG